MPGPEDHQPDRSPRELFRRRGLRCTKQRAVLYTALADCNSHPTAEDLLKMVRPIEPGLSLATVYNTLDAFSEVGLVRRMPSRVGNGPCRFDADVSPHVHVTTPDGRVHDVPADLSDEVLRRLPNGLAEQLSRRMGLRVSAVHVDLVCAEKVDGR